LTGCSPARGYCRQSSALKRVHCRRRRCGPWQLSSRCRRRHCCRGRHPGRRCRLCLVFVVVIVVVVIVVVVVVVVVIVIVIRWLSGLTARRLDGSMAEGLTA
jgi:hypothetical protein